jgi:hypothetical protein
LKSKAKAELADLLESHDAKWRMKKKKCRPQGSFSALYWQMQFEMALELLYKTLVHQEIVFIVFRDDVQSGKPEEDALRSKLTPSYKQSKL